jgi:hypothetical protein
VEPWQAAPKEHSLEGIEMVWHISLLLILLGVYWCVAGMVLWWSYDIGPLIRGGFYQRDQALAIVAKMATIITVLTSLVWLFAVKRKVSGSSWRIGWSVGWKTAVSLLAYAIIVVTRRQLWNPSQGVSDNVMFLPVVGSVNGRFFSEAGLFSFVLEIVPIMGCVSGLLCALQPRCFRASNRETSSQFSQLS